MTMRTPSSPIARMRGFSLVTGIFLLVVLSVLGGFMVMFTGLQQNTVQNDILGVRAYYAARAGINWALYQALEPDNLTPAPPPSFVGCPSGTINTMQGSLAPFTVVVDCTFTDHTEANRFIRVYQIAARACNQACVDAPTPPPTGYVERRIVITVARCQDPDVPPRYICGI